MVLDQIRWQQAKDKIINSYKGDNSIGTLSEKTVHAVVKNYYEPDENYQEIAIEGKCADIYSKEGKIIEIQTRAFSRLKPKLDVFLPSYDVTVVLPIPDHKQIIWVDPDTGELCKPSPNRKYGSPYMAFRELYSIRDYLNNPNLHITLLMMDMIEYKLLSGRSRDRKKYGAERFDRIPTNLTEEITLNRPEDYMQFVPEGLPEIFTSKEFAKCAGIPDRINGMVIGILWRMGVLEKTGSKRGNAIEYRVKEIY